jgi:hypothetical protein
MKQRFLKFECKTGGADICASRSIYLTVRSSINTSLSDTHQMFGLTDVQRTDRSIVEAADMAFAHNIQLNTKGAENTIKKIAVYAVLTGAGGRLNPQRKPAANEEHWRGVA